MKRVYCKESLYELVKEGILSEDEMEFMLTFFRAFSLTEFKINRCDDECTFCIMSECCDLYDFKELIEYDFDLSPLRYMRRIVNEFNLSSWDEIENIILKADDLVYRIYDRLNEVVRRFEK